MSKKDFIEEKKETVVPVEPVIPSKPTSVPEPVVVNDPNVTISGVDKNEGRV